MAEGMAEDSVEMAEVEMAEDSVEMAEDSVAVAYNGTIAPDQRWDRCNRMWLGTRWRHKTYWSGGATY